MKVTFSFTDATDLKSNGMYGVYKTNFELPDEVLQLSDCKERIDEIADLVSRFTEATIAITCKEIDYKN